MCVCVCALKGFFGFFSGFRGCLIRLNPEPTAIQECSEDLLDDRRSRL